MRAGWAGSSLFRAIALMVLAVLAAPAAAETQTQVYGQWHTDISNGLFDAFTVNNAKSRFGLLCSEKCVYYLMLNKPCKEGARYSAMVNTAVDARVVTLTCYRDDRIYIFRFEADLGPILAGGDLGVALAFDGQFNVATFSLTGVIDATRAIVDAQRDSARATPPPTSMTPAPPAPRGR
jgi:hypothetical protein